MASTISGPTDRPDLVQRGAGVAVAILMIVYTLAFIDRQLLNLMLDPIRQTLDLTDTEISVIQGIAFASAYVACGPIFGLLADRVSRRLLLAMAAIVWSLATLACGLATGFWTLFLARAAVGAAEASVQPAAWSALADFYTRATLPRAMSIFLVAPYIGGGLALIFGGTLLASSDAITTMIPRLASFADWRIVFIVVGALGIVIAALMALVREPKRRELRGSGPVAVARKAGTPREVLAFLWQNRAFFGRFYGAMTCIVIILYALPAWMPTLLLRVYSVPISNLGIQYGAVMLIAGTAGVLLGPSLGRLLERWGAGNGMLLVIALALLVMVPTSASIPLLPNYGAALGVAGLLALLYSLPQAMAASMLQLTSPAHMRGLIISIYVMVINIAGLGFAPLLVALLTDVIFGDPAMVGWSLGIVCTAAATIGTWLAIQMRHHFAELDPNSD
jgi:MFS transporter, Spinster family, sphingosine-1-phosphate transporter